MESEQVKSRVPVCYLCPRVALSATYRKLGRPPNETMLEGVLAGNGAPWWERSAPFSEMLQSIFGTPTGYIPRRSWCT
jgi:hypothetical protein